MGDFAARPRTFTMHRAALLLAVAFVGLTLVVAASEEELSAMSKEDLIKALQTTRTELTSTKAHLKHVTHSLDKIYARRKEEEQARKAHEVSEKKAEQKKEEAKKAAKLNKKQKLSDVLMEHGAKYMALKAAKKTAGDGSIKQKQAVLLAAKKGARAGAVGPLKKVARAAAAKAVKNSRAEARKKGTTKKSQLRKVTRAAARAAVAAILTAQDKKVEQVAQKWLKKAVAKFPPSVQLADDTKPNHFTAPPTAHLSLLQKHAEADVVVPEY